MGKCCEQFLEWEILVDVGSSRALLMSQDRYPGLRFDVLQKVGDKAAEGVDILIIAASGLDHESTGAVWKGEISQIFEMLVIDRGEGCRRILAGLQLRKQQALTFCPHGLHIIEEAQSDEFGMYREVPYGGARLDPALSVPENLM